ncbi:MAG TPA: reverse transcriptase domain-containing protein, partial [Candidatus Paceibacterota bacterium]|nr:reverse transcriptase domain-containing protein [Candidatus Paceibacterota bacterium]
MRVYKNLYPLIISPENLFIAWEIFKRDKQRKKDVLEFGMEIEKNIFQLHHELANKTYRHGPYTGFWICDPKRRRIHKATVRDRVVHHALFRVLNNVFEPTFIPTSFSCRLGKGTHKGVRWLKHTVRAVSQNHTRPCFALKCDIKKFFDSVDHEILLELLGRKVKDEAVMA